MNSKIALTASAAVFGLFGLGWFFTPETLSKYWGIVPDAGGYMGQRYGAFMLGFMMISLLARKAANTQARRAIMIGSLFAWVLTDALSIYGAVVLNLNAWGAVAVESLLVVGFVFVLFVKPEPKV